MSTVEYVCPNCLGQTLDADDAALTCARCGKRYAVEDGIPVFRERPAEFDWGAPSERIASMLDAAGRAGWHDAMMRLCQELTPREAELFWLRALGYRRLALQMVLPMRPEARVLDFGSGWGTVSLQLAQRGHHVVAFDQIGLHLRWLRAACQAHGLQNVTLVQGGDTRHLPFPNASFDVVIFNGALEHVAGHTPGDPQAIQRQVLTEAARILTPTGQVYIGIENRLNYKYFLGVPEGHINMKFGALWPRWVTRWYLKWRRHQPFREYTYSLFGYRNLLRSAGFAHQRFFAPWPTYSSAGPFFPVDGSVRSSVWRVQTSHPAGRWPGWYVTRAYAIAASTGAPTASLAEKVLQEIALRAERPLPWTLKGCVFTASSGGKATLRLASDGQPDWSVQVGLSQLAGRRIAAQHRALSALHAGSLPMALTRRIPVSLMTGDVDGYVYGVRGYASGEHGGALIGDPHRRQALCEAAEAFLCALHLAAGRIVQVDDAWCERLIRIPCETVRQWFTADEWAEHGPWFAQRVAWVTKCLKGSTIRVVPFHGDFVPENCIWDRSSRTLSHVLDWELYEDAGLPMVDWVTFLGCAYRPQVKRDMRSRGEDPSQVKFHGYPAIFSDEPLLGALHRYLDRLALDRRLLQPLLFMWWMRQLHDWAPLLLYHPDWRRLRVFPVIERWKQSLAKDGVT